MSKLTEEWYTPESEKDQEAPQRFLLRTLGKARLEQILDIDDEGNVVVPIKNTALAMKLGIRDWENVVGENGEPAKCLPSNHELVSFASRQQLRGEIARRAFLSEDEAKN